MSAFMTIMKKSVLIAGVITLAILSISIVAAQVLPAPPITMSYLSNFFTNLLSGGSLDGTAVKILLVMLLTTILFRPAYNLVGKKSGLAFIISALVSVLGIKYLATYSLIAGLLLPYGALAIAISSMLPFLLISYLLIEIDAPAIRKIGWGMMAGSFIMLWWFRWTDIGDLAWIYLGLGVICILILLFLDSTLRGLMSKASGENSKFSIDVQISNLNTDIANLYVQYSNSAGNTQLQANLGKQIKHKEMTRKHLVKFRTSIP